MNRGSGHWKRPLAGAGVVAAVVVVAATQSSTRASGLARGHRAASASGVAAVSPTIKSAHETAAPAGATCPPIPTYPTSPTDQTQYEVPFTADILNGTVNVGYNEDTGGPGTKPLRGMPYFPWMLHLTGLQGTVSGCVPLPGLSLTVQPANLHLNTYGYLQGPNNCSSSTNGCVLAPHASATFAFTGIAEPGQTSLPLFLAGNFDTASGATVLHYQTTPPSLKVGSPTFDEKYPYPGKGAVKAVNLPAGSPPGARLTTNIYAGSVTVTNTTASTVTSISGEESAGFVTGPSTLGPGQSGVYTFTFDGSSPGFLPNEQTLPLSFTGTGLSGLVRGSGLAYFTFPSLHIAPLSVTGGTINGRPATTAPGPVVSLGSVFAGTVVLTNPTSSPVTAITGETSQPAQLMVMVAPSGTQTPPIVLGGFTLKASVTNPLAASVTGARPDAFGLSPFGALDSAADSSASGVFSATNPPLACGAPVSTTVTTGSSTAVPASPLRLPPHPDGPQWTLHGQPIAGALSGATARLVSNTFPLKVPAATPPGYTFQCSFYGELFNWEIGGVQPNGFYYNCPNCPGYQPSGPADAGAGPGEAQVSIDVLLTSVGALPTCRPTTNAPVSCGS